MVRIRRSHGPGSIPGQGKSFCPPKADREIKLCCIFEKPGPKNLVGV